MARDRDIFERALSEDVTGISLLRSVSALSISGQFRRMALGGARLSNYAFSYTPPAWGRGNIQPTFDFDVLPKSFPPTNVHVLIGRNNVGKTYLLEQMTNSLVTPDEGDFGLFAWRHSNDIFSDDVSEAFSSIVPVTFSAFDPFEPIPNRENKTSSVRYQYIGLKYIGKDEGGKSKPPKSPDDLSKDFGMSVALIITQSAKSERWRRILSILDSDPVFKEAQIWRLRDLFSDLNAIHEQRKALLLLRKKARQIFSELSSGHKIVALTITRLVEKIEERSLVLLDEPEAHLHPPLLSSFVRALSELLMDRNGVAIIATHSPVVLQEVPKSCVWRIWRNGRQKRIERPIAETFGENVGTLTHAIFGLEVVDSGFHKMLSEAVNKGLHYDQVLHLFKGQLGDEARGILRSLIADRDERG